MAMILRFWAINTGQLVDFAWTAVSAQFLYFLLVLLAAYRAMTGSVFRHIGEWGRIVMAAMLWIGLLQVIDSMLPSISGSHFSQDVFVIVLKESLFLGSAALIVFVIQPNFARQFVSWLNGRLWHRPANMV
jgi:hypothetical protein